MENHGEIVIIDDRTTPLFPPRRGQIGVHGYDRVEKGRGGRYPAQESREG